MADHPDACVAIVPARGGSKRIPRKNIRPFLGEPLLARTIRLLHSSGVFSAIVVSTDDEDVAAVARDAGAEVPFRRSAELANDFATTPAVVRDAIRRLEECGRYPTQVGVVYPTAILARVDDLQTGIAMLTDGVDFVVPVTSFPYPIQRALRRLPNDGVELMQPEHYESRSQDLEPAFHDAGQFYFGTRDAWMSGRSVFTAASRALVLPRWRVQDIDTPEDWERAEQLFLLQQR